MAEESALLVYTALGLSVRELVPLWADSVVKPQEPWSVQ
jgi:hypothetical protein